MRSDAPTEVRRAGVASIAAVAGLLLAPMTSSSARGETPQGNPGGAIGLGARGWSAAATNQATPSEQLDFSARAGFASDYIYRGTTLSDHGPAAGAAIEARFGQLYAGATMASVRLPTQPAAEFTISGGFRPKIANIDFGPVLN